MTQYNELLIPNTNYEVGKDIQTGYYLYFHTPKHRTRFREGYKADEAALRMYMNSPLHSWCHANFGIAFVTNRYNVVRVENGAAIYYGNERVTIYDLLQTVDISDGDFSDSNIYVIDTPYLYIKLLRKDTNVYTYSGEADAVLYNQYWFEINSKLYWLGFINVMTYKKYSTVKFSMRDSSTSSSFEFTENETGLSQLFGGNNFFVCRLPDNYSSKTSEIDWIKPGFSKGKLIYTNKSIYEVHTKEFSKLEKHLIELNEMGLDLDIEKELNLFLSAPDLMLECIDFFEKAFKKREAFEKKRKPKDSKLCFVVRATFDKQFYCVAGVASTAEQIQYDFDRNLFYVTFNGTQVDEIALTYRNLANIVNDHRKDLTEAKEYLIKYDFLTYIQTEADKKITSLKEKYGYSGIVTDSILLSLIKAVKRFRKKKLDELYTEMKKQGIVHSKWKSEYSLYTFIRRYVPDAIYQYRCDWLGQQSFDIYIPSQNVAIEYQGIQHFESVSAFGGKGSLEENLIRDNRKKHIAEENGVSILYWDYIYEINNENVISFLNDNHITSSIDLINLTGVVDNIQMIPPTQRTEKSSKKPSANKPIKKNTSSYVVQYNLDGILVGKYHSIKEASLVSGVGHSSIGKVLMGQRHSAGRFVWKRFANDCIPERIVIDFDISKITDGK